MSRRHELIAEDCNGVQVSRPIAARPAVMRSLKIDAKTNRVPNIVSIARML